MKIPLQAITKGSNTDISPLIHPSDQPYLLNGCTNTWKLGALTKDTGHKYLGSALASGKSVQSLYDFRQARGTQKVLATSSNAGNTATELYYNTDGLGSSWTEIAAAETAWTSPNILVEFETFIGYCFMVGSKESVTTTTFVTSASLTGTTFSTATNVTNMPKARFIKRYKDRLYVANCEVSGTKHPYRVYFSSVPAAGAITWTPATDFFDVDYGEEITGLAVAWDKLIIFTYNSTYFYDLSTLRLVWKQGCIAHRTIRNKGPYLLWCDEDGVWVSTGGQPQNISGEVGVIIKAALPQYFFAEIVDESYWLYIDDVTANDVSYNNAALVFDISKSIWWLREFNTTINVLSSFRDKWLDRHYLIFGGASGQVYRKGKYTDSPLLKSDSGDDIYSSFELAPFHLNTLDSFIKLNEVIAYADRPGGIKLYARVLDNTSRILTAYKPLGELTEYINRFYVDVDDGVMIQIRGEEFGQNEYWSFLGYVLDVEVDSDIPIISN